MESTTLSKQGHTNTGTNSHNVDRTPQKLDAQAQLQGNNIVIQGVT